MSTFILSVNFVAALARSFSFAKGCIRAARSMYDQLIAALFAFPLSFFEETSFGDIYNRVGQDTNCIDDQLPFLLNIFLAQSFVVVGTVVVMIYILPPVIIIIAVSLFIYYRIQTSYRRTSRQLRRVESACRSPVYALLAVRQQRRI